MWLGVRPIIRLASTPTASGRSSFTLTATTDGSSSTMPRPRTYTRVLAVPRSTAISRPSSEKLLSRIRDALLRRCSVGTCRVRMTTLAFRWTCRCRRTGSSRRAASVLRLRESGGGHKGAPGSATPACTSIPWSTGVPVRSRGARPPGQEVRPGRGRRGRSPAPPTRRCRSRAPGSRSSRWPGRRGWCRGRRSTGLVAPIRVRTILPGVVRTLDHQHHHRRPGDEGQQVLEERLALVLGVVADGHLAGDRSEAPRPPGAAPCARAG